MNYLMTLDEEMKLLSNTNRQIKKTQQTLKKLFARKERILSDIDFLESEPLIYKDDSQDEYINHQIETYGYIKLF